jgi:hypothetical protein
VKGFGAFGDVAVEYLDGNCRKYRAEGRKLVSFISLTEINTVSESGNVEWLKRKMNAGRSADSATDRNNTDSARTSKTTAEDTL